MGRNNRTRRQQKQRQKQKKQKNTGKTQRKDFVAIEEIMYLCHPVSTAIANNEPPPPSIIAEWVQTPVSPVNIKLRTLLVGFVEYLFHHDTATGTLEDLTPYLHKLQEADFGWLYSLLYCYCLISENNLSLGNADKLVEQLHSDTLQRDMAVKNPHLFQSLCLPFYLFLSVMGLPLPGRSTGNFKYWLRQFFAGTPLDYLVPELDKFFKLKRPKPTQKTVMALEAALGRIDWNRDDPYRDSLAKLLQLFLQKRIGEKHCKAENWRACPNLSALAGITETQTDTAWSGIKFKDTGTATLNQLNRQVSTDFMPYAQRLQLEVFKLRILSQYVGHGEVGRGDFERQLRQLTDLMIGGVPQDQTEMAQQCLDTTCEWLAAGVSEGKLPVPKVERLRKIQRRRPKDYRLAVLMFLATVGRESTDRNNTETVFGSIHFGLFFHGLVQQRNAKLFLKAFYWPLSNEIKKDLFIQFCRKLFLGMDEDHAFRYWEQLRKQLADKGREPFASIRKGQPCEAEALFYIALALVDNPADTDWLHAEHISSLIRSASELLTKRLNDFGEENIIRLLNVLTKHEHAGSLLHSWEPVLTLIGNISYIDELEPFLRLVLQKLGKREDRLSDKYRELYSICRQLPALRSLLPEKQRAEKGKEPGNKRGWRKKTVVPEYNPDLFDELS